MSWLDNIRATLGGMQQPLYEGTMSGLQTVGDVAGTPGSVARGVGTTLGQLVAGNPEATTSAQRTFSGIFNPDQRITGREVNENAGLGSSALGGVATDILSDPLAMGALVSGGAHLAARGGSALRGILGNGAAPAARAAAPRMYTANDFVLNPRAVLRAQSAPVADSAADTGNAMLNARRQFTVLNDLELDGFNEPAYRAVGGMRPGPGSSDWDQATAYGRMRAYGERAQDVRESAESALQYAQDITRQGGTPMGVYDPLDRVAMIPPNPASELPRPSRLAQFIRDESSGGAMRGGDIASPTNLTRRHEVGHGIIDIARDSGNFSGLPRQWAAAGRMQESSSPLLRGLGLINEESAMHGVGAGRGLLANLTGQMQFLNNPAASYMNQAASRSALAGDIYGSALIPRMGLAGYGAGAAGAAALVGGQQ